MQEIFERYIFLIDIFDKKAYLEPRNFLWHNAVNIWKIYFPYRYIWYKKPTWSQGTFSGTMKGCRPHSDTQLEHFSQGVKHFFSFFLAYLLLIISLISWNIGFFKSKNAFLTDFSQVQIYKHLQFAFAFLPSFQHFQQNYSNTYLHYNKVPFRNIVHILYPAYTYCTYKVGHPPTYG